jgi:hypothetical protein
MRTSAKRLKAMSQPFNLTHEDSSPIVHGLCWDEFELRI